MTKYTEQLGKKIADAMELDNIYWVKSVRCTASALKQLLFTDLVTFVTF